MKTYLLVISICLAWSCPAVEPAAEPGQVLSNPLLAAAWPSNGEALGALELTDLRLGDRLTLARGLTPTFELTDGTRWDPARSEPGHIRRKPGRIAITYPVHESGLRMEWEAALPADAGHLIVTVRIEAAAAPVGIDRVVFVNSRIPGAEQVGTVDGSVVRSDRFFVAVEHPLAHNRVMADGEVTCALPRGNTLRPGVAWTFSCVVGVTPPGQFRRGFLTYLEQRRARPYRPFLHYNSWYHLNIDRPDNHMTEAECLETIEHIGRELVERRQVDLDAFVWDDGWDDFNSLWGFHQDFPRGFTPLKKRAAAYGAAQGVWMSPWGGYGGPKQKRIAYGRDHGFETNANGFSMSGPKYGAAFRDVCLTMMREHGVQFFKFDGMGSGNGTGAKGELADDVDAVLELCRELRAENPDLFISATVGTWASPFWLLYADSIWRQGGDTGFHGAGNQREQWITYRDMFAYSHVAQAGPLYPFNALMLHGPCIGDRANPARMPLNEASARSEFRTFFGSGTALQELYISPHLFTSAMWDNLATAARWARARTDVLVDSHWIGGDPGEGEVYGWAAWRPGLGTVTLRNPSDQPQSYALDLGQGLELPSEYRVAHRLSSPFPDQRVQHLDVDGDTPVTIELKPFEVLVFEVRPETP